MARNSRSLQSIGPLWMMALACPCFPQTPAGEIRLSVVDSSGAAMAATGLLEGPIRRSFDVDALGSYTISALPFGRYRLRVSRDGFAVHTAAIQVTSTDPVKHRAQLAIGRSAFSVNVVSATPLAGLDRDLSEIAAPVQTANDRDLETTASLDLSAFLNRRANNVFVNEIQGNPLQPDVNYRGFTASPLLGTPQGLSIYLDGVRLNQPFGDVASWDLIPRLAISEMALIPGSNPLFGLNTLGGSLSLRTKDGISHPRSMLQLQGGAFGRKIADFEHGGSTAPGRLHWYLGSTMFFEDGWRESSPSNVRQFFAKLGRQRERSSNHLTLSYANNSLIGNGLQEQRLLARDYRSIYTKPDITANRAPLLNWSIQKTITPKISFSGNAYFRYIGTRTLNGDMNEASLDQSVYQPNAAERAALAAAGYTGFPLAGENASNTPFPFWRCIANVLRRDEPAEKCNGLLNTSVSQQRNYGVSGQVSWFGLIGVVRHQLTAGAAYDGNSLGYSQSTELGYLTPDRGVTGVGAFADGVTGGDIDGEPFDTRVHLSGRIRGSSAHFTDTLTFAQRLNLTISGRFQQVTVDNRDRIRPQAGTGSLTGFHRFHRFNPAVGATYRAAGALSLFGSYLEGNRAPTSIELGCADPAAPCRLPNALAGDPPLRQVRTRTVEAGVRGGASDSPIRWSAGWFQASNRDDILFVASEQTGFGYFKNFGLTRRRGIEIDASARWKRVTLGSGYTLLDATFRSPEEVNGAGNSTNKNALQGRPGLEGTIEIEPGKRIPLTPRRLFKAWAEIQASQRLSFDLGAVGVSSSFARGNENNLHRPDGRYYLGPGASPGYGVASLGGRYQIASRVQLFAQVNNLFDRRYYTGAQLGATGFTANATFIARPFPAIQGEFPLQNSTFFAPGAPRGAWAGVRIGF